jgi:hypothetical protein
MVFVHKFKYKRFTIIGELTFMASQHRVHRFVGYEMDPSISWRALLLIDANFTLNIDLWWKFQVRAIAELRGPRILPTSTSTHVPLTSKVLRPKAFRRSTSPMSKFRTARRSGRCSNHSQS